MPFKNVGFEIILASRPEDERLTAEIFFDGKFVALISHERTDGEFDIETPGTGLVEDRIVRKVDLLRFQDAVALACRRLRGEVK